MSRNPILCNPKHESEPIQHTEAKKAFMVFSPKASPIFLQSTDVIDFSIHFMNADYLVTVRVPGGQRAGNRPGGWTATGERNEQVCDWLDSSLIFSLLVLPEITLCDSPVPAPQRFAAPMLSAPCKFLATRSPWSDDNRPPREAMTVKSLLHSAVSVYSTMASRASEHKYVRLSGRSNFFTLAI